MLAICGLIIILLFCEAENGPNSIRYNPRSMFTGSVGTAHQQNTGNPPTSLLRTTNYLYSNDTLSDPPSTVPTLTPIELPTFEPSVNQNGIPTESPTVVPSISPSMEATITPSLPTESPTERPITEPSSNPTSFPTEIGSQILNGDPSVNPTIAPTPVPTMELTNMPTIVPSLSPTANPTINEPTSIPTTTPSSIPTRTPLPTSYPTSTPTLAPSISPSRRPSSRPTSGPSSRPSDVPSIRPSCMPSARPSSLPTPGGSTGQVWWYLVSARVQLIADSSLTRHYDLVGITEDVTYAFSFALTDDLTESDRVKITVMSFPIKGSVSKDVTSFQGFLAEPSFRRLSSSNDIPERTSDATALHVMKTYVSQIVLAETNSTIEYYVRAWCHSRKVATEVHTAFYSIKANPTLVLTPLHEKGLRNVDDVRIEEVSVVVTIAGPSEYSSELSPDRIMFIILGTIGFFITALILLRNVSWMFKERNTIRRSIRNRCYCCGECCYAIQREASDCWSEVQHFLFPHRGFNLAGTSEEDDFVDFQSSIHYRGQHRTYLDDNDDEKVSNNTSNHNSDHISTSSSGSSSPVSPHAASLLKGKMQGQFGLFSSSAKALLNGKSNSLKKSGGDYHKVSPRTANPLREVYSAFTIEEDDDGDIEINYDHHPSLGSNPDQSSIYHAEDEDDVVSIELASVPNNTNS